MDELSSLNIPYRIGFDKTSTTNTKLSESFWRRYEIVQHLLNEMQINIRPSDPIQKEEGKSVDSSTSNNTGAEDTINNSPLLPNPPKKKPLSFFLSNLFRKVSTFYKIELHCKFSGLHWCISKRYSDFYKLHASLVSSLHTYQTLHFRTRGNSGYTLNQQNHYNVLTNRLLISLQKLCGIGSTKKKTRIPRRYFRADNRTIIYERLFAFENYMQLLILVQSELACFQILQECFQVVPKDGSLNLLLVDLTESINCFLGSPTGQLQCHRKILLSLLALQDLKNNFYSNSLVCIVCSNIKNSILAYSMSNDPALKDTRGFVKLPCEHIGHEKCLVEWLVNCSAKCVVCAADAALEFENN